MLSCNFAMLLISCRRKLPLRVNNNHTYQKSWQIFWVKLIPSDLQYIDYVGSSHVGLLIQKFNESGSGFHVLANEMYDQVQCQMSIANKAKN